MGTENENNLKSSQLSLAVDKEPLTEIVKLINKDTIKERDTTGRTALSRAAVTGRVDAIELLLNSGAALDCVDYTGRSPLSWAAESGSLAAVKLLIDRGANVNLKDVKGTGPLGWAHLAGHGPDIRVIKRVLQEHGASKVGEIWFPQLWLLLGKWRNMVPDTFIKPKPPRK
ncbi:conserved hypothetical protein [Histoplasma capsulatum H143]|uniref:Uncharacterized protein n=1 Tax=Ajellomyces capsulatus (strain H143) TaxID=544712 RepID=C6HDV3_AJECH|nr:conserved hypothetical protein [Histoplasma capsulatum H143]